MSTPDEITQMLADVEQRESALTDWERGFIDSITVQLGCNRPLTVKQDEKLTSIWERIT
jgi:hypothetical protein